MDAIDEELYFLILRYLESGPCQEASKVLKGELIKHNALPKRIDWEGRSYQRPYDELVDTHPHIGSDHLKKICARLPGLLDEKFPPRVRGVQSLLGAGLQSLLRSEETSGVTLRPSFYLHCRYEALPYLPPNLKQPPSLLRYIQGTQYTGHTKPAHSLPVELYKTFRFQRRFLGHLTAVYCTLYDRTGNFIFTGADDKLIKVWSALSGRLLATLRGHNGEIQDLCVNYENTILASASVDTTVRIWCIQTSVCRYVLHGHSATVSSIQFCPLADGDTRFLISTSEDGSLCFWKYSKSTKVFDETPQKLTERAGTNMICSTFSPGGNFLATGSADSVVRVYFLSQQGGERIGELAAHTGTVDTIVYSNHSDRFISGSKDGTARIWRYLRQEWLNLVIEMPYEYRRNQSRTRRFIPMTVDMVAWTADDAHVITAASDFSVRIWCSTSGKQIRILTGHEDNVFTMECSPTIKNLLVTAAHDGRLKLWDMNTGTVLTDYYNAISGQGFGAVYDCKWAPDGYSFTATDSHGFLLRFGLGDNKKLHEDKVPTEMFFHTDYRALARDNNDHVLDQLTMRAVHLLPPPFLVDIDATPYPPKFQRLVPGREHLPDRYLIPQLVETADGEREVADQEIPEELSQSQPTHPSTSSQSSSTETPSTTSSALSSTQPAATSTSSLETTQEHEDAAADGRLKLRTLIPEMSAALVNLLEACRARLMVAERDRYVEESRKRPLREDEEQISMEGAVYIKASKRGQTNYNTRTVRRQQRVEQAARDHMGAGAERESDAETEYNSTAITLSSTSSDEEEEVVQRLRVRRTRNANTVNSINDSSDDSTSLDEDDKGSSSSDYSDWVEDNKASLQPPSRSSGRRTTAPQPFSPDDEEQPTTSRPRKVVISRATRAARARKRAKRITAQFESSIMCEATNPEMLDQARVPEWLTSCQPRKSPYFPQMGDEVIYFMQGHQKYVDLVQRSDLYKKPRSLPWDKVSLRQQELVRVMGIKYEVTLPRFIRVCCLKLGRIYPESKRFTGTHFNIKYHDMDNVIDFLVLRQHFDRAEQRNWQCGDRCRSIIDDKWWTGVITKQQPYDNQFTDSQFLSLTVQWDEDEAEPVSPWDLEPLADNQDGVVLKGTDVTEEEQESLVYTPDETEWPETGRDQECDRIAGCIEQLMTYRVCELFNAPVDLEEYRDYGITIAYPMDLTTIRDRLQNKFYRRVTAIQFDVRHIASNAEQYNRPGTEIVQSARIVTEVCLQMIADPTCTNIKSIYEGLDLNDEYYAVIDQPSTSQAEANSTECEEFDWIAGAEEILQVAFESDDSMPFRAPVNHSELPDYNQHVSVPMDFSTVKESLQSNVYQTLDGFIEDVRLIISNSRRYNTVKHSKIYKMTLRLHALMEERIKSLKDRQRRHNALLAGQRRRKKSHRSKSKDSKRAKQQYPIDPLLPGPSTRQSVRLKTKSQINTHWAAPSSATSLSSASQTNGLSSSHYATRSTTGHLKPKVFSDDIIVQSTTSLPSRKAARRVVVSSEDEEASTEEETSPVVKPRWKSTAVMKDSESDYDKDTDEENGDVEIEDIDDQDTTDVDEAQSEFEHDTDESIESDGDNPSRSRCPLNGHSSNQYNRTYSRKRSGPPTTANGSSKHQVKRRRTARNFSEQDPLMSRRSTRLRTEAVYREMGSDTDLSENSDDEDITSTSTSSRGRVRKLRTRIFKRR